MNPASSLVVLLPILVIALVAWVLLTRRAKPAAHQFTRKPFLTENQKHVLGLLETALPEHRIMAQVAMAALLATTGHDRRKANAARNRFSQKVVDFVIVTRDDAEVVALVELDHRSQHAAKDAGRDAMTAAAGYRTIRISGKPRPTAQSVRAAVADLASTAATTSRQTLAPVS